MLGSLDGATVGRDDATTVGKDDAATVGSEDPTSVGWVLGFSDGTTVGSKDGNIVVGNNVGKNVGVKVVGAGVTGANDGRLQPQLPTTWTGNKAQVAGSIRPASPNPCNSAHVVVSFGSKLSTSLSGLTIILPSPHTLHGGNGDDDCADTPKDKCWCWCCGSGVTSKQTRRQPTRTGKDDGCDG